MMKRMRKLFRVILVVSMMMSMLSISTYAAEPAPELEFICGKEVHVHDESCSCGKAQDFICEVPEHSHEACETNCTVQYDWDCEFTEEHEHNDVDCYTVHICDGCAKVPCALDGVPELTCTKTPHTHSDESGDCYKEHTCVDACYTCGQAAHAHGDDCYVAHECDEECYTCGKEEHEHVTACVRKEANVWHGDKIAYDVKTGHDAYNFISYYPGGDYGAYELSNHMVSSDGGAHNSIPQTLVMLDASEDYTWTPDGVYSFGSSNYEVMYCCDEDTGYNHGIYYKRMNLEDSSYYNEEDAAHIRAIITNSYPFVSLDQMKANLKAEGFEDAAELTRADVISAVQMAVWTYANDAHALKYSQTFDVPSNTQWGKSIHDYTNEMKELKDGELKPWWKTGKRKFTVDNTVGERINDLADRTVV